MLLAHPEVATRPCSECAKWSYKPDGTIAKRQGKPVPLPQGAKTPCATCPKKSPLEAKQFELTERNLLCVQAYYEVKATHGLCLSDRERRDPILIRNLSIIDRIVNLYERNKTVASLSDRISDTFKEVQQQRK